MKFSGTTKLSDKTPEEIQVEWSADVAAGRNMPTKQLKDIILEGEKRLVGARAKWHAEQEKLRREDRAREHIVEGF